MAYEVRAQRVLGEALLPLARGEFDHPRARMLTDALLHLDQIGIGIDAVQTTGDDQALHDAHPIY